MKLVVTILASVLSLLVAAFCIFGFMASFEPTNNALAFRLGYGLVGVSCLIAVFLLIFRSTSRRDRRLPWQ